MARIAVHTLITFAALAASYSWVSHGRAVRVTDLPQDYGSARSWLDGDSAYRTLEELHARYDLPPDSPEVMARTNPHPPVAVLLTVPYAMADFEAALTGVRWTQLVALALTWSLCYHLFPPRVPGWAWAVAGGAFGFWTPVWQGLAWAQPVGLLALGTLAIWWLARSEKAFAFGFMLAVVTLIRPFVAIQIVLVCGWSFRQQAKAAAGLLLGSMIPFMALGITPWAWYRLASAAGGYVAECGSVPGVLNLGPGGGQVLYASAATVLAWLRWRGLDADATVALAAVVAMLAYPLAWFQYDTALIPVVAWVVAGVSVTGNRVALWGLVIYLLARAVPDMIPTPGGTGVAEFLARNKHGLQVLARGVLLGAVAAICRSSWGGTRPHPP